MRRKHSYQTKSVKTISVDALRKELEGQRVVLGVDVAKEDFKAALMKENQQVVEIIRWEHPRETPQMVELLTGLNAKIIEAVMEPTGTYGDAVQYAFRKVGITNYQINAKRVHDAAEVYDGVPSKHDPKDATIIGKLHLDGLTKPCDEPSGEQKELTAAIASMNMFQDEYTRHTSRLEAQLAKYWPELPQLLELGSHTMVELILTFGTPAEVSKREKEVRELMLKVCSFKGWRDKIELVITSAKTSLGVPPVAGELEGLQILAYELRRAKKKYNQRKTVVHKLSVKNEAIHNLAAVVGTTTAAVIVSELGELQEYSAPTATQSAGGLGLKERSSGKHKGELKITKRGSPLVRKYLYFAVLRLIQKDEVIRAWYLRKVARDGVKLKMKAIIAIMRKLLRALWYVARGEKFDSTKLFDVRRLDFVKR